MQKEVGKSLVSDIDIEKIATLENVTLENLQGESTLNKQNSLAVDETNTKFPTVTAVNMGLSTKQNILRLYS